MHSPSTKTSDMRITPLLTVLPLLLGTTIQAQDVVVDATGPDTFTTPDMHGIMNGSSDIVFSVTIDLSPAKGAFWDFDGASSFGNATEPIIGTTNYNGTVTWTHGPAYPNDPVLTANFSPSLGPGQFIRFGADTDFFVSDPCPGGNFALGGALVTVDYQIQGEVTCAYRFISTDASSARCVNPFTLLEPTPGVAGTNNCIDWLSATPFSNVAIVYGFAQGSTPVGGACPGLFMDIANPGLAGIFDSGPTGEGLECGTIPAGLSGRVMYFQAIDLTGCQVSNLVCMFIF